VPPGLPGHQDRRQDDGPYHHPAAGGRGAQDRGEFPRPLHQREGIRLPGLHLSQGHPGLHDTGTLAHPHVWIKMAPSIGRKTELVLQSIRRRVEGWVAKSIMR
jgi:hypothetical protein